MELILNVETHFQTFRLLKDTMTDILSVHPNNTNINITLCTNLPSTCQVHSLLSSLTACSMHTQHTRRTNLRVLLMHFNSLQPELRAHLLLSGRVYVRLCLICTEHVELTERERCITYLTSVQWRCEQTSQWWEQMNKGRAADKQTAWVWHKLEKGPVRFTLMLPPSFTSLNWD